MSFGINGPSPMHGIQEAQSMRNNGGGGNLGYFQRRNKKGKQKENWVIDNHSCRKVGTESMKRVVQAYREYGYHGFWDNGYSYLKEDELDNVAQPSESILLVSDVRLYKNNYGKAKIDFTWNGLRYPMRGVSLTDQDFYDILDNEEVCYKYAIIVISIPKDADWTHPETGERRAYKFVSKVFGVN